MPVAALVAAMETLAPARYAEAWDNVGLLVGSPADALRSLLLTIDLTQAVLAEAQRRRCDLVLAYHPPLFKPINRLSSDHVVHQAIRAGIAIYSPHTALDVADGGTNDTLANLLGLRDIQPLRPAGVTADALHKLIVFVPGPQLDRVSNAIFNAGAGQLGDYSHCAFQSVGTSTFLPGDRAKPAIGKRGQLEAVTEIRFETILPAGKVPAVIAAMRKAHPYEEPAFDLLKLATLPESTVGTGRFGTMPSPLPFTTLVQRVKRRLRLRSVLVSPQARRTIRRVAIGAGAGRDLLDAAIAQKADVYLTGELSHHDALRAAAAGLTTICTLHSNSERLALPPLARRLRPLLPGVKIALSRTDRDPFSII